MGQLIDEEDCEVCVPFEQGWIFTYGEKVWPRVLNLFLQGHLL